MTKHLWFAGILVALLFASCGSSAVATVSATSTATATPSPSPTAVPTVSPSVIANCFGAGTKAADVTLIGDILILRGGLGGLDYPSVSLPDGTALTKPYKLNSYDTDFYGKNFPNSPTTNPLVENEHGGSYSVSVCNISGTQTHTIQAVTAKLASFTAYTGQLSSWNFCDGTLTSHHSLYGGGCGGAKAGCECFHATLPANTPVGTVLTVKQTGNDLNTPGDNAGTLPLALHPGSEMSFDVGVDQPSPAGTYAFQLGINVDGMAIFGQATPSALFAPVAHTWNGQNCQKPAMLAQIAATTPETYYICD